MDRNDAIVRLVDRVQLGRSSFRVLVNLGALLEGPHWEITLTREAALAIKRRGVEMRLVLESGAPKEAKVDRVLLKEVSRARRCFEALLAGRAASVEGVAAIEGVDACYLSNLLPLAFLSPDIVAAIVRGTQPADLTAKKLIRRHRAALGMAGPEAGPRLPIAARPIRWRSGFGPGATGCRAEVTPPRRKPQKSLLYQSVDARGG
ncbi:MAG: hypothetical protein WCE28_28595, partial [Bradyrhizobium sp.]